MLLRVASFLSQGTVGAYAALREVFQGLCSEFLGACAECSSCLFVNLFYGEPACVALNEKAAGWRGDEACGVVVLAVGEEETLFEELCGLRGLSSEAVYYPRHAGLYAAFYGNYFLLCLHAVYDEGLSRFFGYEGVCLEYFFLHFEVCRALYLVYATFAYCNHAIERGGSLHGCNLLVGAGEYLPRMNACRVQKAVAVLRRVAVVYYGCGVGAVGVCMQVGVVHLMERGRIPSRPTGGNGVFFLLQGKGLLWGRAL